MSHHVFEQLSPYSVEADTGLTAEDRRADSRERTRAVETFLNTEAGAVHPIWDAKPNELPAPKDEANLQETFE